MKAIFSTLILIAAVQTILTLFPAQTPPQPSPQGEGEELSLSTDSSIKKTNIKTPPPVGRQGGVFQSGKATYYSARMHGRKMADGTRYDRNGFTCAHRTLPFNTMVRVVNKKNGKETTVRVADRGPFGKGIVIDLSNSAAAELGMLRAGVVPVDLYIVSQPD